MKDYNDNIDDLLSEIDNASESPIDDTSLEKNKLISDLSSDEIEEEAEEGTEKDYSTDIPASDIPESTSKKEEKKVEDTTEKISPKEEFETVSFTVKGSRSWNTREPYIAQINIEQLRKNHDDLKKSFYFIEKGEKELTTQGELKKAMMKHITDRTGIMERYRDFVYKKIYLQAQDFGVFFGFNDDNLKLFVYNLGVLTFYRILINIFQSSKIGYCYKLLTGNKVTKLLPFEFIKETTLKWYEDNINIFDLPFDGINNYNDIKRVVSAKYFSEIEKNNKKLDETIDRERLNLDSRFDRDEFYKKKWEEWFGRANIIVYNRFLERTIFKVHERLSQ